LPTADGIPSDTATQRLVSPTTSTALGNATATTTALDTPTDETVRATLAEALSDSGRQPADTTDDIEVPT